MNPLVLVIVALVVLALGYGFYGGWLARKWGIEPSRETPALQEEDGVEYITAPSYVVFNHHFSSIAGIGAITGPILAAIFGWLPVVLWVLVGGIFIGAAQDFGSLFTSLRTKGKALFLSVEETIDGTTKRLFCAFAFLVLLLAIASLSSLVVDTFQVDSTQSSALNQVNSQVALISTFFVFAAIIWGMLTLGRNISAAPALCAGIVLVALMVAAGMVFPDVLCLDATTWTFIIGAYMFAAALAPVWVLLQPRDYLSGILLIGIMVLALIGIVGSVASGSVSNFDMPLFTDFVVTSEAYDARSGQILLDEAGRTISNPVAQGGFLFPVLFVTVAGGAVSGFHSLVASGTTSKQLESEHLAQPVGFGGMMLVCLLAIISLCSVGFAWNAYTAGDYSTPTQVFADGLSSMCALVPGLNDLPATKTFTYNLFGLAVSMFCLGSLDTAARLGRFAFQGFWVPKGQTQSDVKGLRKLVSNKYVATFVTVALGVGLGVSGYSIVWPLFGAANQLLASLALIAVSAWLNSAHRTSGMLTLPRLITWFIAFASLLLTIFQKIIGLLTGGDILVFSIQLACALILLLIAIVIAAKGRKVVLTNEEHLSQDAL